MNFPFSVVVIPLIVGAIAFAGSMVTRSGMAWYRTIILPSWTPPGSVISTAWTIIFMLSAWAMILVWNNAPRDDRFVWIIAAAIANALLNVLWSYLFFGRGNIGGALIEMIALFLSVIVLVLMIRPHSLVAAGLFVPYALWVAFATYLTLQIYLLNHK